MELNDAVCDAARRSRDARFDGRFFIAVTTTRVYCRPVCPVPAPKDEHIRYFPTAAAAEAAGYRPCLRCRPEASPGTPAWSGTSAVVSRSLRLIGDGALDTTDVERFAAAMGVTARHLRRLFLRHLGATPTAIALTRRLHFAKKLVDETSLPFEQVAYAAGFGSVRRFNSEIRRVYSRTPTQLRQLAGKRAESIEHERYQFRLAYRPPYDWDAIIEILRANAIPGVEHVDRTRYRRTIAIGEHTGEIEVRPDAGFALALDIRFGDPKQLLVIVERVRRMFDLGADPAAIGEQLGADPLLAPRLEHHPGIRVPGAWEAGELATLALAGGRATARIVELFGTRTASGAMVFPSPAQLAAAPLERTGITPRTAELIKRFDPHALDELPAATAQYLAMRALGEPDAFPASDPTLRRALGDRTPRDVERLSEAWRPWRAYAAMLLWSSP